MASRDRSSLMRLANIPLDLYTIRSEPSLLRTSSFLTSSTDAYSPSVNCLTSSITSPSAEIQPVHASLSPALNESHAQILAAVLLLMAKIPHIRAEHAVDD